MKGIDLVCLAKVESESERAREREREWERERHTVYEGDSGVRLCQSALECLCLNIQARVTALRHRYMATREGGQACIRFQSGAHI